MHPGFPLVLLANRDEFYERPTIKAGFWPDFPDILAGRDLVGGGTWLGVTRRGRFAAVTNFRDPSASKGKHSRGRLVADFLKSDEPAESYLKGIEHKKHEFSGFNLLAGEINSRTSELFYFSNRGGQIKKLDAGIYGLSNHLLETPWRKTEKGKALLTDLIRREEFSKEAFFDILSDGSLAEDADLPDTGIGYEREKLLSAIFIKTPVYGTRCSTVLTFDRNFKIDLDERVFV
jgi:uncharacterized protein with NRDE domain